jgi:hypothetical protein
MRTYGNPTFMEAEGLLLCSQERTIGPCPEPDEFSPHFHVLCISDPFQYCSPIYA